MKLAGNREALLKAIFAQCPEAEAAIEKSRHIKGQMETYQVAALFALATQYDGGNILEIGTFIGHSASIMAQAAPRARIVTLNSAAHEVKTARHNLGQWPNVKVAQAISWDYLDTYDGPPLDMIFVDGDHKRAVKDLPWWAWLADGGLMLFHDYSRERCPPVYEAVNGLGKMLGREPDVLIVDDQEIGMAGFYNREVQNA